MKTIHSIKDQVFLKYGKIMNTPVMELCNAAECIKMPLEGTSYERSFPELEKVEEFRNIQKWFGGEVKLEGGMCWGYNQKMNAVEYHRSSELNIAVTDIVLMLGDVRDIKENHYDSQHLELFYVPKGTTVELYGTTLHFAPCQTEASGFRAIVILPDGTNAPLSEQAKMETIGMEGEERLLFAKNKWLIAHKECGDAIHDTAFPGIQGENIFLQSI